MIFQYEYWIALVIAILCIMDKRVGTNIPIFCWKTSVFTTEESLLRQNRVVQQWNKKYQGLRPDTKKNDDKLEQSKHAIDDVIAENDDFVSSSLEEIKKLTTITHLITTKYLANLEELLRNVKKAPVHVVEALRGLPEHLAILQTEIQRTAVNPLFAPYTAPLEKLYRSLTEIDKKTSFQRETWFLSHNTYINKQNETR